MKRFMFLPLFFTVLMAGYQARADDWKDGIAEFSDEPISADGNMGDKAPNINFIVVGAMAKAKIGMKNLDKKSVTNLSKPGDKNENSIVVAPGSRVDKVINVVVQK